MDIPFAYLTRNLCQSNNCNVNDGEKCFFALLSLMNMWFWCLVATSEIRFFSWSNPHTRNENRLCALHQRKSLTLITINCIGFLCLCGLHNSNWIHTFQKSLIAKNVHQELTSDWFVCVLCRGGSFFLSNEWNDCDLSDTWYLHKWDSFFHPANTYLEINHDEKPRLSNRKSQLKLWKTFWMFKLTEVI